MALTASQLSLLSSEPPSWWKKLCSSTCQVVLDIFTMGGNLNQLFALSTLQTTAVISILFILLVVLSVYFTTIKYPAHLPRYGEKEGATSFSLKTRKTYYTNCKNMFKEAYEKVCLHLLCLAQEQLLTSPSIPSTAAQFSSQASASATRSSSRTLRSNG